MSEQVICIWSDHMADWVWGNGSDQEKPDSALVAAAATPVPSPTSVSEQDGTGVLTPGKGCISGGQGGVFTITCQVPGCTAKLMRQPSKCFVCQSTHFVFSVVLLLFVSNFVFM